MRNIPLRAFNKFAQWLIDLLPLHKMFNHDTHIHLAYRVLLRRKVDKGGKQYHLTSLKNKRVHSSHIFEVLCDSPEYRKLQNPKHYTRCLIVRELPSADTIVDLGGSSREGPEGALYLMGYRNPWRRLIVADLTPRERHEEWRKENSEPKIVTTPFGPVEYLYGSIGDPALFSEGSFVDLVWSGNSIEHVTEKEGRQMIKTAFHILKPGGEFHLDTPNRLVTRRLDGERFSHPEHKLEYTHAQLHPMLAAQGFEILEQRGILDCTNVISQEDFKEENLIHCPDHTNDMKEGYFLYYRCRRPE